MYNNEARVLLKNLLKRFKRINEDSYELSGVLTEDEMNALRLAFSNLHPDFSDVELSQNGRTESRKLESIDNKNPDDPEGGDVAATAGLDVGAPVSEIELNFDVLDLPKPPEDRRLCLDFGTAMSKVTLIRDISPARSYEDIEVLRLGVPGDQEEVSETMLVSSVYIDNEGRIRFGNDAVKYSQLEAQDGTRQRLDNIKRFLSEEGLDSQVSAILNPTEVSVTYGDMVLCYLMYLTWTLNRCLEGLNEPRNIARRFAIPCLSREKSKDAEKILRGMLGDAQVLADTFSKNLPDGVSLEEFSQALSQLKNTDRRYEFVKENVTEPLGVAGSIMSWHDDMASFKSLIMVVDVGAGTSDFSVYKMGYDRENTISNASAVSRSSRGITEAGNYLDKILKGLVLREAGIDSSHQLWVNIQGNLELELRNYKETLFRDGSVPVRLFNDQIVTIDLEQFLKLPQVEKFSQSLKDCRDQILSSIDESFIHGAPKGVLAIVLTGGGSSLPMVKDLAEGVVNINGYNLNLHQTKEFPEWLREEYPELEDDYQRIAVSLGGARNQIIIGGKEINVTAGDIKSRPVLDGYFTKGL
ncbi:hypothetical protein CEK62_09255 [Alcanivorax sp. N3-2A]|nr:hypothetical protein CEK62_09255 [Alcanivorax sp. N3-2A]